MDQYIHIALIGAVSAGKSTLLNAMLVARYSDMSIQRTTATDIVYYETNDNDCDVQTTMLNIHESNQRANREIMNKTANGGELKYEDIKSIEYYVPRIYDLLEGKLKPGIRFAIHDLPGLNDSKTSDVYHRYVIEHFHQYNIVLFVVDIISGLNTKDEKNILELILKGIKLNKDKYGIETELIVILNKCDEMEIVDKNSCEARPIDDEYKAMAKQVRTIVTTTAKTMKVDNLVRFVCLSAEDAFIYRVYGRYPLCIIDTKHRNKFGINEYGKNKWNKMDDSEKNDAFKARITIENIKFATELTGFSCFDFELSNVLTFDKQFIHLLNYLRLEMTKIKMMAKKPGDTIDMELMRFAVIRDELTDICKNYDKKMSEYNFFQDKFTGFLAEFYHINKKYLVPLSPTKDDIITYTISSKLIRIFTIIYETFSCWINCDENEGVYVSKNTSENFINKNSDNKIHLTGTANESDSEESNGPIIIGKKNIKHHYRVKSMNQQKENKKENEYENDVVEENEAKDDDDNEAEKEDTEDNEDEEDEDNEDEEYEDNEDEEEEEDNEDEEEDETDEANEDEDEDNEDEEEDETENGNENEDSNNEDDAEVDDEENETEVDDEDEVEYEENEAKVDDEDEDEVEDEDNYNKSNILVKISIVGENIDKYLKEVVTCYATPYGTIINMLEKFIDNKAKRISVDFLCCNLCHYDFIKTERFAALNDERKIAERIISIIENLEPHCTAAQWCYCIVQNIKIIINQWSSVGNAHNSMGGVAYNTDPLSIIQIFNKYYIHCGIKDDNGYDINKKLNTILHWAHKNINEYADGKEILPSILMDACLSKLSQIYPKHIIDLDVFYGVSPEHAHLPVDKFYESEHWKTH